MSGSDPLDRDRGRLDAQAEQRQLDYLKGMASAPMGWPATPPDERPLDPRELMEMLDRGAAEAAEEKSAGPWYARGRTYVALLLFGLLVVVLLWLI